MNLLACFLGRIDYDAAFALQRELAARRAAGSVQDLLLLLEHDAVYTLGRRAEDTEILLDGDALAARGIQVARSDRGGRVTYHGPGQLVGYPIVDLGTSNDLVGYVRALERALIDVAAVYGIEGSRVEGATGVWVGDTKLAAIGVHVSAGITTHGFAINVTTDLDAFNGIVPCGIVDKGVTSIQALTGQAPSVHEVAEVAAERVARALDRTLVRTDARALGIEVRAHA